MALLRVLGLIGYLILLPFVTCLQFLFWRRRKRPDFSADIALVTGAAQGLGKEIAFKLAQCGATLVLWDINDEKVRGVCDELKALGGEAFAYRVDCSKREEIYAAADRVREEVGNVSILVNNAGVYSFKLFSDTEEGDFERTINVNFMAHYWTVRAFLPWMLENDYGYIVSICSVAAFMGGFAGYGPSKAAVYNFCDGLRLELSLAKKNGVSVSCICPWQIDTDMTASMGTLPLHRLYPVLKRQQVADRVVEAITNKEFYVIIPGSFRWMIWMKLLLPIAVQDEMLSLSGGESIIQACKRE